MKNVKRINVMLLLFSICGFLCMQSCVTLKQPAITRKASLDNYKYVYITNTQQKSSIKGGVNNFGYGVQGYTNSQSVSPAEIISSHFIRHGYTVVDEIKEKNLNETIIVHYGECGRRRVGMFSYTIEVLIQITSAKTDEVLCVGTAEGIGSTEADDIRIAIDRCLSAILAQ